MKKTVNKKHQKSTESAVTPLHDRVLIREEEDNVGETTTASGFIIPGNDKDRSTKRGIVVAVGQGRYDDGKIIPMIVKVGDKVLYSWGDKVSVSGQEYVVVRESEIIGVLK